MAIDFLDLDVLVEERNGATTVRVLDSPAGQTSALPFVVPFDDLELDNFLLRVGRPRATRRAFQLPGADAVALREAKDIGGRLLAALFPGQAAGCLTASLAQARAKGVGLRLRLRLTDCPRLAPYPWELLYDERVDRFLCLSSYTPVVRYLELPEPTPALPTEHPLRILVVISSPADVPALDVEREWANLQRAMAGVVDRGLVEIERLPVATMDQLAKRLFSKRYHVLHFIGHGGFDEQTGGVLVFEDGHGRARLVPADELGIHLHDHRSMGLVILNACEGARGGLTDPFSGAAQSLVQQGLGAVIAMQFEVTDEAAIAFSETFYEALATGYPVESAVAEGRKSVLSLPNPTEWATPVLYLRAPDGRIFDLPPTPVVAAAPAPQSDDLQPVVLEPEAGGDAPAGIPVPAVAVVEAPEQAAAPVEPRAPAVPPVAPPSVVPDRASHVGVPAVAVVPGEVPPVEAPLPAVERSNDDVASDDPPAVVARHRRPTAPVEPSPPRSRRRAVLVAGAITLVLVVALALVPDDEEDGGGGAPDDTVEVDDTEVAAAVVRVDGNRPWTDTGITVAGGDRVEIVASGSVQHDDANPSSFVGPDGAGADVDPVLNTPGQGVYLHPPGHGGLLARLGDGEPWGVGSGWQGDAVGDGPLQLGINDFNHGDVDAAVANNTGAFDVEVRVWRTG